MKLTTFEVLKLFLFLSILTATLPTEAQITVPMDASKKILFIPLSSIESQYLDNTSKLPEIEYTDSFYIDLSNKIVQNEIAGHFKSIAMIDPENLVKFTSVIIHDKKDSSTLPDSVTRIITEIADQYKADFVVIPNFCKLKYTAIHQKNWRDGKYGDSYERPVAYKAHAEYKISFYLKNGKLNWSNAGIGKAAKPMFYSMVKKKHFEKDIVKNSKKIFAPPLVKALRKAITASFKPIF